MLTPSFFHDLSKSRRKMPVQPARLYGDLLPLIIVDTSIPREFTESTRAVNYNCEVQMRKTVRTYYLHRQQVLTDLDGERRDLYKHAFALHKAMVATNTNRRSSTSSVFKNSDTNNNNNEYTFRPGPLRSTRAMMTSERQAAIKTTDLLNSDGGNSSAERHSLGDDELLVPSLTPDEEFNDFLTVKPFGRVINYNNGGDEISASQGGNNSNPENNSEDPVFISDETPIGSLGKNPIVNDNSSNKTRKQASYKFSDDTLPKFIGGTTTTLQGNDGGIMLFTQGIQPVKTRWPKMSQPVGTDGLEPIEEGRHTTLSSVSDYYSFRRSGGRDTAISTASQPEGISDESSVKVTITKNKRVPILATETVDLSEENNKYELRPGSGQIRADAGLNGHLLKNDNYSEKTVLKAKQFNMFSKNGNKNKGEKLTTMLPRLMITTGKMAKTSKQANRLADWNWNTNFNAASFDFVVKNQRPAGLINNKPSPADSIVIPPPNYYNVSLISSENNKHLLRNRKTIVRVKPLIPGKTRYIDWELRPDGRYQSRVVTYQVPRFKFDADHLTFKADPTLCVGGKAAKAVLIEGPSKAPGAPAEAKNLAEAAFETAEALINHTSKYEEQVSPLSLVPSPVPLENYLSEEVGNDVQI